MRGRRRKHTTRQDPLAIPAPDLVGRNFVAPAPDRLWTADITYLPTDEGFLYLAFILSTSTPAKWWDGLWPAICAAKWWRLLLRWRSEEGTLLRGSSTIAIGERNTRLSRSARGWTKQESCRRWVGWDQRWIMPFARALSPLFRSEIGVSRHPDRQAARASIFEFIELFYNRMRRHSSLGYVSPSEYEQAIVEEAAVT
jgi:putative transposase